MTLIVGISCHHFACMVSDRIITISPANKFAVHDKVSNKNLIIRTRDGAALMGYSGNAYIGAIPTDQWIASALLGEKIKERAGPLLAAVRRPLPNMAIAIWRLANALLNVRERNTLWILITGFRMRRGREMPFIAKLEPRRLRVAMRPRLRDRMFRVESIGQGIDGADIMGGIESLKKGDAFTDNVEQALDACQIVIEKTSHKNRTVGRDVLRMAINRIRKREVYFSFSDVSSSKRSYSPWVIGLRGMHAPSVSSGGGMTFDLGGIIVEDRSPRLDQGTGAWAEGQLRPTPPV